MIGESLWPQILKLDTHTSPAAILRAQGTLLGQKTSNIVTGVVRKTSSRKMDMTYEFALCAPALDNYTFSLFYISFDVIQPYPVEIYNSEILGLYRDAAPATAPKVSTGEEPPHDVEDLWIECSSEEDFMAALKVIFSLPRTLHIISALYNQSKA